MLVIARNRNEQLRIGDEIQIKVINVRANIVSLSITGPKEISLVQPELRKKPIITFKKSTRSLS